MHTKKNFSYYPQKNSLSSKVEELVVFLHGLGSDGNDLITLVPFFQTHFPNTYYIAPNGIEAYDMAAFGRQWYSCLDRSEKKMKQLLEANINIIYQLINIKQRELSLTNKETVIIGFSQGGIVGNYLTLIQNNETPFKAMISLSSKIFVPDVILNKNTPFCLIHGEEDEILPVNSLEHISDVLTQNNIKFSKYILKNLAHSIDTRGVEYIINFLKNLNSN